MESKNDSAGSKSKLTSPVPDGMIVNNVNGGVESIMRREELPEDANDLNGRPSENAANKVYVVPEAELKEIDDDLGPFVGVPPKDTSSYPSKSEVESKLKQLHGTFNLKKGFDSIFLVDGCYYYFVAKSYTKILCKWLRGKDTETTDLTVDNSSLCVDGKRSCLDRHFSIKADVVSKECWDQLIHWFGGGISIKVRAVRGRAKGGKLIRVVCGNDNSHYRRFFFNMYDTISNIKNDICEVFGVDPESARLHDFYQHKPHERIDDENNMHKLVSAAKLVHNNLCYLEVKNEDSDFTITYPKKKRYVRSDYNTDGLEPSMARNFRHGYLGSSAHAYNNAYSYGYNGYSSNYGWQTSSFAQPQVDTITGPSKQARGVVGLNNLGNTCYMNSIIQCLSNTFLIKEPFLSKTYEGDINKTNVLGYKGEVAKAFYNVMRLLWSGDGTAVRPAGFKKAITDAKTEFRGYQQHDSQEFLSQLLDALHEDLNRVIEKPVTESIEANGRPDAIVAEESLKNYKLRNDSIVTDLFSGLFKSTVTCPDDKCRNVSVTFDPYMILPLPLQGSETSYKVLQVVFVPLNPELQPSSIDVIVPKHGPVYLLRESIKERIGINKLNMQEIERVKKGRKLKLSDNACVSVALGINASDMEVVGKRDIVLFRLENKSLEPTPVETTADLDLLSQDNTIICYETLDYTSFEQLTLSPEEGWRRELNFPRHEQPNNEEVAIVPEADRYSIGAKDCPFLRNDVWHGRYNHVSDEQVLRIEITDVKAMDWAAYAEYKKEVYSKYGGDHPDLQFDKKEFSRRQVFYVEAQADSMECTDSDTVYRTKGETQFELKGVYIKNVENLDQNVNIYETFAEGQKKNKKKNSKKSDKALSCDNLLAIANTLAPGVMEKRHLHGSFVLRPHKREIFRSATARFSEEDTSREPIILQGAVEHNFRFMWGQFQVDSFYVKGQFICQRYESMNWNSRYIENGVEDTGEVKNLSMVPEPFKRDNRVLVLLGHKLQGNFMRTVHAGIPDAFFAPKEITESGLMDMIKARYRIYFETEFKLTGAKTTEIDASSGQEVDIIEQRLQKLVVKRATEKFETSEYGSMRNRAYNSVGRVLDPQEDRRVSRSREHTVFFVCEWEHYPFLEARPESVFSKKSKSNEEKMTLHKALDLFSKTDRLSKRNTWYCNKCKDHKEAFKQLQLWSVPKVLVIQFKRFSQNETRMRADKLDIPVEFPFEVNLTDYTLCSKVAGQSVKTDVEATNKELAYDYELVAVSSHIGGGLGSGHYVACAKNEIDNKWYKFDDNRVSPIPDGNINEIVNPQAYVLFYVRKSELQQRKLVLEQRKLEVVENIPQVEPSTPQPEPAEDIKATKPPTGKDEQVVKPTIQHKIEPVNLPTHARLSHNTPAQDIGIEEGSQPIVTIADDYKQQEIRDNRGHFARHPPKDRNTYPSKQDVIKTLTEISQRFTPRSGFQAFKLRDGVLYYLLSTKYVTKLVSWFKSKEDQGVPDLTVDNSDLASTGSETHLPTKLKIHQQCQVLNEASWNQLIQWFGGGAEIRVRCLKGNIWNTKLIRVFCGSNGMNFRRFYFNAQETVQDIKQEVCEAFGVDPERSRFHDFFGGSPFARLDRQEDLNMSIQKTKMMHNNICYLETPNMNGFFTIRYADKPKATANRGIKRYMPFAKKNSTPTSKSYAASTDLLVGSVNGNGNGVKGLSKVDEISYMNSVLQCLANTRFFPQFFITEAYKRDINTSNVLGFKGAIAKAFHNILALFQDKKGSILNPAGFVQALAVAGLNKKDEKHFLARLIEALHEDLNRVVKKPVTDRVEPKGRPDALIAAESIQTYKSRNDSIVTDLLTGFLKSTITCPKNSCGNVSVTFEPFTVLDLPVQAGESPYKSVQVLFVPGNPEEKPIQTEVLVPTEGPLYLLRQILKEKLGINDLNSREKSRLKKNKKLRLTENETVKVALGFSERDIAGNRDIVIFGIDSSRLKSMYFDSTADIGEVIKSDTLICYETFSFSPFEQSNFRPEKLWKRKLGFPRQAGTTVEEVPEADKMQIGLPSCPFLLGDVWHGKYSFNKIGQVLRLEVTGVSQMDWTTYERYRAEVIREHGTSNIDVQLDEADFEQQAVFQVEVQADTKGKHVGMQNESQFQLKGIYFTQGRIEESEKKADENLNRLGAFEKWYSHGSFVLRPTAERNIIQSSYRRRNDDSRNPIQLEGSVDAQYRLMWGKYKVENADVTGSFSCGRYESMNWDSHLIGREAPIVKNWTRVPQTINDSRAMVLLCYQQGSSFYFTPTGIPEAFFVPQDITEGELLDMIYARFRVYFEQEFKIVGATNNTTVDDVTGVERDEIDQRLEELKIKRSTSTFDARSSAGVIRSGSNARVSTEKVIYLICESLFYPFLSSRPENLLKFESGTTNGSTVPLHQSLEMLGQPRRMGETQDWYCNVCKKHQVAFKQQQIWSLPSVLVVQFDRFVDATAGTRATKLDVPVDFPFEMNFAPFTLSAKSSNKSTKSDIENMNKELELSYELVAVTSCIDVTFKKQYIACAKNAVDGAWYRFDNSNVSKISQEKMYDSVGPQAYNLFYIKKSEL